MVADPFRFAPVRVAGDVWPLLAAERLVRRGRLFLRPGEATWARDACGGRNRNRFAEAFVAAQILVAAFIDGDRCLTDLAAKKHFRCKRGTAWLTS